MQTTNWALRTLTTSYVLWKDEKKMTTVADSALHEMKMTTVADSALHGKKMTTVADSGHPLETLNGLWRCPCWLDIAFVLF
jgi:hypothetical protein